MIVRAWQLTPVTSPLVGEVGSPAQRAGREGGDGPRNQTNTPHPIPPPQGGRGQTAA
jgi:hypothetical protein